MSTTVIRFGEPSAPAVVLVPELAATVRTMRPLAEAWVAAGRRVVLLDLYGGARPTFDYGPVISEDIPDEIERAGRGAILAGFGFGGHLALLAAAGMMAAPPVVTIAAGIPDEAEDARPTLLQRLGFDGLAKLGDLSRMFGGVRDGISSDGSGDLDRLDDVRTRVLAVAIEGDRTIPPSAVDRLADRLVVPVVRVDVATEARGDAHVRWLGTDAPRVVTAIEAWSAGSVG
jgi:dienelactone hydrolase